MIDNTINLENSEKAVLVGLITPQQNETKANEYLDELAFLADTAGAVTQKRFLQRVDSPNSRTFVGKGKLEEIRQYIEDNGIGLAIFDDDLSSKQVVNLERELKVKHEPHPRHIRKARPDSQCQNPGRACPIPVSAPPTHSNVDPP